MLVLKKIVFVFAVLVSCGIFADESGKLLKNGRLDMVPMSVAPKQWVGDKVPKRLVKKGILATLDQAVLVEVKEFNKQQGYFYQYIPAPEGGFRHPYAVVSGYVKSHMRNGGALEIKIYNNKKYLGYAKVYTQRADKWEFLKTSVSLKGVNKIQVLCRYWRARKYIGNTVEFGDISLSFADKPLNRDDFEKKKIKVVVLGDSTVQTYALGSGIVGWGQLLHNYFNSDVGIHNHALSGRSSKTFIEEGLLDKALKDKPDYALIQFGHNDDHPGKPEFTDAKTGYKKYLRRYVEAFKRIGAKVVFVTPMCRMLLRNSKIYRDTLKPYSESMKEVAKETGCVVVDLHDASKAFFERTGGKCVKLYGRYGRDRTHFNPVGAKKITEILVANLAKSGSPLAECLKPEYKQTKK